MSAMEGGIGGRERACFTAIVLRFVGLLVARHGFPPTSAGAEVCPFLLWAIVCEVIELVGRMVENHFSNDGCYLVLRT